MPTNGEARAEAPYWRARLEAILDLHKGSMFGHIRPFLHELRHAGDHIRLVHVRRPGKIVAFGRKDELDPGYDLAVSQATRAGFASCVRPVGGTFAPLHAGSLIVDEFGYSYNAGAHSRARFEFHSERLREVFAQLGVADVRLGQVPGEYCPGEYSVNSRGRSKLSGTAQRVVQNAWLVSSVVQVAGAADLRPVASAIAAAMGRTIETSAIGSLREEAGRSGQDVGVVDVAERIVDSYCREGLSTAAILGI